MNASHQDDPFDLGRFINYIMKDGKKSLVKATWTNNKPGVRTEWEALARSLNATKDQIAAHTHATNGSRVLRVTAKEQ